MESFIFGLIISIYIIMKALDFLSDYLNQQARQRKVPSNVDDVYDDEEYLALQAYHKDLSLFKWINSILKFGVLLVLLLSGLLARFANYTLTLSDSMLVTTFIFLGVIFLINLIPSTIRNYIFTFKIEEKHGFNKTTVPLFIRDSLIGLALSTVLAAILLSIIVNLFEALDVWFIALASIVTFIIVLIINLAYVKWILPLFNTLTPLEESELKTSIENLAFQADYKVNKIHIMDASKRSTKLNAFFSGFGRFKNVVLFDTLTEKMDDPEVLAVLAHEIGHAKHKDIIKNIVMSAFQLLLIFSLLYLFFTQDIIYQAFDLDALHFGFMLIIFGISILPLNALLSVLGNYLSRKAEFKADAYAKKMTSKDSMIGALKKLARENYSNLTPHELKVLLEYSHPPMHKRIEALEDH